MAHKELITRYAKQLNESHQRIVELEVAVADARAELDTTKLDGSRRMPGDSPEIGRLRAELNKKENRIRELDAAVSKHPHANEAEAAVRKNNLQEAQSPVKDLEARRLEIEGFREAAIDADARAKAQSTRIEDLERRLREAKAAVGPPAAEGERIKVLEGMVEARDKKVERLEAKVGKLDAKGRETARRNATIGLENGRLKASMAALKRLHETAIHDEVEAATKEFVGLADQLGREKKRRYAVPS